MRFFRRTRAVGGDPFCVICGCVMKWYTDTDGFDTKTGWQLFSRRWRCLIDRRHFHGYDEPDYPEDADDA